MLSNLSRVQARSALRARSLHTSNGASSTSGATFARSLFAAGAGFAAVSVAAAAAPQKQAETKEEGESRSLVRSYSNVKSRALYEDLIQEYTFAEFVWLDADQVARSKTKVIPNKKGVTLDDLKDWNYDGSSTGQAPGEDSEVILKPVKIFPDPFMGQHHVMVLCETFTPAGEPLPTNTRAFARKIFDQAPELVPWFGIEQEYVMFKDGVPLGFSMQGGRIVYPGPQGPYYCAAGAENTFGRNIAMAHLQACLHAGLKISGINAEVMPGQWEFQVGPCEGIEEGDHMTMARYILRRVAEEHGVTISIDPKPIQGDWNGSGCHANFSTKPMREEEDALNKHIIPAIERLGKRHKEHIEAYGAGNEQRLTGKHETASMEKFSWGIADRGCSVRIGNDVAKAGKGYFEDRRPAANIDPYIVSSMIFDSSCLRK